MNIGNISIKTKIRVRFAECDAQSIVFNARYADYADLAATEFMRALLGSFARLQEAGFDNQVVNLNIDWFNSARFDDVLTLDCRLAKVGKTSFTLATQISKDAESLVNVRTTYVIVDTQHYQKAPIPDVLRDAFAKDYTALIDQSGQI